MTRAIHWPATTRPPDEPNDRDDQGWSGFESDEISLPAEVVDYLMTHTVTLDESRKSGMERIREIRSQSRYTERHIRNAFGVDHDDDIDAFYTPEYYAPPGDRYNPIDVEFEVVTEPKQLKP